MDIVATIDQRIIELRTKHQELALSEHRHRINELQRLRAHLLLTTEKENPCYLRNPSGLPTATTSLGS